MCRFPFIMRTIPLLSKLIVTMSFRVLEQLYTTISNAIILLVLRSFSSKKSFLLLSISWKKIFSIFFLEGVSVCSFNGDHFVLIFREESFSSYSFFHLLFWKRFSCLLFQGRFFFFSLFSSLFFFSKVVRGVSLRSEFNFRRDCVVS